MGNVNFVNKLKSWIGKDTALSVKDSNVQPRLSNDVDLVGYYGSDVTHAQSAWTSVSRDLNDEKRARIPVLLKSLAKEGHHTPFEKSMLHFVVTVDTATQIQLLKHRIGVSINGESARYKELKDDRCYMPLEFEVIPEIQALYVEHMNSSYSRYHEALKELEYHYGRKRAKESARFFLPYGNQLTLDISFNFRSFMHFIELRRAPDAQLEIWQLANSMLKSVKAIEGSPFQYSLEAFGL